MDLMDDTHMRTHANKHTHTHTFQWSLPSPLSTSLRFILSSLSLCFRLPLMFSSDCVFSPPHVCPILLERKIVRERESIETRRKENHIFSHACLLSLSVSVLCFLAQVGRRGPGVSLNLLFPLWSLIKTPGVPASAPSLPTTTTYLP